MDIDHLYYDVKKHTKSGMMNSLSRHEFFELLVRIALKKYPAPIPSIQAIETFLSNDLITNVKNGEEKYNGYRQSQIYVKEVSDLLKQYQETIKRAFVKVAPGSVAKIVEYFQKICKVTDKLTIVKCIPYSKSLFIPPQSEFIGNTACVTT
jgi:hypothetical protein